MNEVLDRMVHPHIKATIAREAREPRLIIMLLFFILGSLGAMWIPFFPWWMVLIIAFITAIISYGFPYLAMVVLSVFVIGAAGYQTPEFGLFMMLFTLVVLMVGLFEWKLGFLVLMAIFLSRFGLSMLVPIVAATMLPLVLSLSVVVLSGVFLTFLVACGNLTIAGMFVGPVHETSFMIFLQPTLADFSPGDLGSALGGLSGADLTVMGNVMTDNLGLSIVPLLQIILWGAAVFITYMIFNRERKTMKFPLFKTLIPAGVLAGTYFSALYALLTPTGPAITAGALIIPVTISGILMGRAANEFFFTYFMNLEMASGVGTRISDMENLGHSSFNLIGGLDDVKEDIKESIMIPLLMSDVSNKYGVEAPHGILLFGPPGCGKTMLMKALANELKVEMVTVKCSDIMSKWYGESETKLAELFETAKERRPAIIFFDDMEAMAKHRDLYAGDDVTPRLLSILLAELDGMDNASGIILVGTTNKPELVDPALLRPGRFDKVIYVPPPGLHERVEILRVHLRNRPVDDDLNLETVAARLERFSGADLANVAKEAAVLAMKRAMKTGEDARITNDDLYRVASTVKPSISLSMLKEYEMLKMDFERKMHHSKTDKDRWVVSWDELVHLDRIKNVIMGYIEILVREPDVLSDFKLKTGRGVLLFGPPGCGKSKILQAAAHDLKIPLQIVSATEFVGTASTGSLPVKEVFYRARENTPSILLIEDIDVIGSRNAIEGQDAGKAISQILNEIDNLEEKENVLVAVTTNDPASLHPVMLRPGRFDKMFYVPPPDMEARRMLFQLYLSDIPRCSDVDDVLLDELARKTDGYSANDIEAIVDEAKLMAVVGNAECDTREVEKDNLLKALALVETSIRPEYMASAEQFMKTFKVRK